MIKKLSLGESQPRSLEIIATKSENKDKLETDDDKKSKGTEVKDNELTAKIRDIPNLNLSPPKIPDSSVTSFSDFAKNDPLFKVKLLPKISDKIEPTESLGEENIAVMKVDTKIANVDVVGEEKTATEAIAGSGTPNRNKKSNWYKLARADTINIINNVSLKPARK